MVARRNGARMVAAPVMMALGLAAMAKPALAQDAQNPREQVYVAPHIGYENVALSDATASASKGGLRYGTTLGVDTPVGRHTRIGLELGLSRGNSTLILADTVGNAISVKQGREITALAKAGWMVTPVLEAFVVGGYANTHLGVSGKQGNLTLSYAGVNMSGFKLGGGAEWFVAPNIRLRAEYDYTNLGVIRINGVDTGVKARRHEVSAGLAYGF